MTKHHLNSAVETSTIEGNQIACSGTSHYEMQVNKNEGEGALSHGKTL